VHSKPKAPNLNWYNVEALFERIIIDIVGPFPESKRGTKRHQQWWMFW
jgi:hypothetical protein